MVTILLGYKREWPTREAAMDYCKALLREADGMVPDVTDRLYILLDNIRAGKDPAVDFED